MCGRAGSDDRPSATRARREPLASLHPGQLKLLGAVTADEMPGREFLPCRRLCPAHLDRVRTARMEITPPGRRRRIRDLPLQDDTRRARTGIRLGNCRQAYAGIRPPQHKQSVAYYDEN